MTINTQRTIGSSTELAEALDHASALANINRPVLIIGERGTGKELIAERLHFLSPRWEQTFIAFNCAAVSEELMESELFGHEPGAFTGANRVHHGRFERADGGTLFLDELGTMSLRLQEKLLRVIEYGEFERLGGQKTLKVDVRIIAATNADLKSMASNNQFRADLLDRLAFDVINVPPLRVRHGDIAELTDYFAMRMAIELGKTEAPTFSSEAMKQLTSYDWPGNVRELKNVVERSVFRFYSELTKTHEDNLLEQIVIDPFYTGSESPTSTNLEQDTNHHSQQSNTHTSPSPSPSPSPSIWNNLRNNLPKQNEPIDFKQAIFDFEQALLQQALKNNNDSQKHAAKALGLSYDQLRGLIKKHRK